MSLLETLTKTAQDWSTLATMRFHVLDSQNQDQLGGSSLSNGGVASIWPRGRGEKTGCTVGAENWPKVPPAVMLWGSAGQSLSPLLLFQPGSHI